MDPRTLKHWLNERPDAALLDAIDGREVHQDILPMLEAELHRSSQRLQRLKEYRNSLASFAYCLQPEILSNILLIYAKDNDMLFDLRWTRLLLVCRRWYDVAANTQNLWSYIDASATPIGYGANRPLLSQELDARDVRRIEAQRSRAGRSPLSIRMRIYDPPSDMKMAYTTVFWEPFCLSFLDLAAEHSYVCDLVRSMAPLHHANLKTLALHSSPKFGPDPSPLDIRDPLDVMLRNNIPSLQDLSLSDISFDWTLLHDLHTLCIKYYMSVPVPFALRDIVAALEQCPRLNTLKLVLPTDFELGGTAGFDPVPMTCLYTVIVQSMVLTACTELLQSLSHLPSSARIIVCTPGTADVQSISSLASYIGDHASSEGAPPIRSVGLKLSPIPQPPGFGNEELPPILPDARLGIVGERWLEHDRRDEHHHWVEVPYENAENAYIGLDVGIPVFSSDHILSNLLELLPLSETTHLDLRSAHELSTSHLNMLFIALPALTTVIVDLKPSAVKALVVALRAHLRNHGRTGATRIVLDHGRSTQNIGWDGVGQPLAGVQARGALVRVMTFCAESARAGAPLEAVELVHEPQQSRYRVLESPSDMDWSELSRDLQDGFIHQGVLHSCRPDLDGAKRDLFMTLDE
ncbi:unnamed protein product [Peniophora sp. CBMAI 1063]|nr:unnamed protein product [Peniophora sp. CBMAI 1063]